MTEKRNAHVQQNRHEAEQKTRQQFDGIGLTKRNSDYMFRFNKELKKTKLSDERKVEIVNQMKDELLVEQKHGATARNLYGTVEERINFIMNPPKKKISMMDNFAPNAIFNALFFFVIFNLLYGITLMIQTNAKDKQSVGILSLVLISLVFGIFMPIMTRLLDGNVKHKYSGLVRFGLLILSVIVWIGAFMVIVSIPQAGINIAVSPIVNFILAAISAFAAFWIHKNYEITVNVMTPRTPNRR
ncbi:MULTISPECIES: DUF1129 family protein [Apilactobacillus]|uniref:Integral membrane protein n=1 Tax=Apilactobacillus kunkeei TaxID=148814 RepID=A0A0P7K293_9LACO|nr:DUF1129 family protein [Apilactobacillus kunkeei]KPN83886.1 uncharacterized protein RZ78_05990 [Apilactobacillus kunkeei]MCT6848528.1 DUF1129 domain-containing protein [Apilactobacillus kunkeei]